MPTLISNKHDGKFSSIDNLESITQSVDQPIIELCSVSKIYPNGSKAFINANLEIQAGEFLFITGSSGSGKSTFLKLLYGDEIPTEGEVIVLSNHVAALKGDRLSLLRRKIGIIFQDYKLIHQRTVSENISFVLQAQGYTRKEIQRRLEPTLKLVGLLSKANCFPTQLSGGEQQRVTIARAIVGTPPIILADEPTGNLDPDNSWQIMQILKKLNSFGATVIVTTHDEHLVRRSHSSVVQIQNGTVCRK
ncbi:MAG: cell division ATP-binding protein FtsE [Cyanobacteria bacterium P01_A01_bin.45]